MYAPNVRLVADVFGAVCCLVLSVRLRVCVGKVVRLGVCARRVWLCALCGGGSSRLVDSALRDAFWGGCVGGTCVEVFTGRVVRAPKQKC